MNIRSIASILMLGGMVAGSYTEPVQAVSFELDPGTAMLITMTGIAVMESPRVIRKAKAYVANMLDKAWESAKPSIIKVAHKAAKIGLAATAASGLLGAVCDHGDLSGPVFSRQINKNTFYSLSATLLPLTYLACYTARKLSQKPKEKKNQSIVEIQLHGDCAQVVTSTA